MDENYILLDLIIKGKRIVIGSIYGPNGNNVNFYNILRRDLERLDQAFIIGGDFNTIICNEGGIGRSRGGRWPISWRSLADLVEVRWPISWRSAGRSRGGRWPISWRSLADLVEVAGRSRGGVPGFYPRL